MFADMKTRKSGVAYSMDLRERVLALYDEGLKTKQVAERLKVARSWARRIKQWRNEGKSIAPRPVGGSKPKLDENARRDLARFVDEQPDATLEELRTRLAAELKISISIGALWETLAAMKLSLKKKSLIAAEQSRPDVAAARAVFFEQLKDVPLQDIVVLDESYATTKFTRLRGRTRRGMRLRAAVPHGHWKLLTVIAAMNIHGVQAAMTIDAATDTDVFGAFIEQVLAPTLRPGQVVVMDNLTAHKVGWIVQRIQAAGCRVMFLPPYSPDFSPIEPMWSKVKQLLRSVAARTVDALQNAVGVALQAITSSDCRGYFQHCGYTPQMK